MKLIFWRFSGWSWLRKRIIWKEILKRSLTLCKITNKINCKFPRVYGNYTVHTFRSLCYFWHLTIGEIFCWGRKRVESQQYFAELDFLDIAVLDLIKFCDILYYTAFKWTPIQVSVKSVKSQNSLTNNEKVSKFLWNNSKNLFVWELWVRNQLSTTSP